ncbi:MAG: hypothetical protein GYA30_10530 [Chloroflexi bacterium]|nr:hypothetical protein [Chloroflexota bacterium]OQB03193.1 MAG: hypothetical protein BWY25_00091 [Chloroflexi bacterium ADurb.Bin222]HOC21721.1 hypothetical protein [Anaerolineae bacterium]HOS79505.1 hypothetical protein [Anaerolineae bacterium]HOV47868.1 hypothetical protein [Anaerolineae bacterium]
MSEPTIEVLAETDEYAVLMTRDEDGEVIYHVELGNATLHFFGDEWNEFMDLMRQAMR